MSGTRFPVTVLVGAAVWANFHVDIVGESDVMTGTPDDVPPLISITLRGLDRPGYRAYPLVDHIADKVCAIFTRHGVQQRPSTRYKDLLDLVSFATTTSVGAVELYHALVSEAERRSIAFPSHFDVPDLELWQTGYAREARRAVTPIAATLAEALAIVRPFLDPLLDNTAAGAWDPAQQTWRSS